jgi:hypothetical protein
VGAAFQPRWPYCFPHRGWKAAPTKLYKYFIPEPENMISKQKLQESLNSGEAVDE